MAKAIAEPTGDKKCPVCGKSFFVQWPTLWTYKRGAPYPKYFCSYKCVREFDKNKEEKVVGKPRVISPENEQEAIKCATAGGDPIAYLKNCGAKNPSAAWYHIRSKIKDTDPETYEKLPHLYRKKTDAPKATLADAMEGMQNAADEFFVKCEDMGLSIHSVETPEDPAPQYKAIVLKSDIQYKIWSIQTDLGTYSADDEYFEFKSAKNKSDAIEMTIEDMVALAKELPDAMRLLGVEI